MITVNTNMASLIAQNSFNRASNSMNNALNRLSTGYRINSAKDDAAGSAIAAKLETKISSYAQATKNAEMGADYLQSADSTLSTMQSMVQRMRDLTEQAANGTYGADERKAIQSEIDGLTQELYRIKNTAEFNGKNLFGAEETQNAPLVMKSVIIPLPQKNGSVPQIYSANSEVVSAPKKAVLKSIATSTVAVESLGGTFPTDKSQIYGISTKEELKQLATWVNSGKNTSGFTFVLDNDIDLKDENWIAIGTSGNIFRGTFNGNGHVISNLTINQELNSSQKMIGLFGQVYGATISDVTLNDMNITITGTTSDIFVGGVVAKLQRASTISNCNVKGNITCSVKRARIGGLAGEIGDNQVLGEECKVSNCYADINIESTGYESFVGGLLGATWSSKGGLVVTNSQTTGNIKVSGSKTSNGGIVGMLFNAGSGTIATDIKYSKTDAIVDGGTNVGLIVGNCESSRMVLSPLDVEYKPQDGIGVVGNDGDGKPDIDLYKDNINLINNPNIVIPVPPALQPPKPPTPPTPARKSAPDTAINLQVGINADDSSTIWVDTGFKIGSFDIDVTTDATAQASLVNIDEMLDKITAKRTDIGASLNRLESVMAQQETMRTSMTSALSQIKDADIARESAIYVKNQILQQTTASLLATANQNPNIALNLL